MIRLAICIGKTIGIHLILWSLTVCGITSSVSADENSNPNYEAEIIAILGAPGEENFIQPFSVASEAIEEAAKNSPAILHKIKDSDSGSKSPKEQLLSKITELNSESDLPLWLIFVGHGTFDGIDAKFNLHGPDIELKELVESLANYKRDLVIVLGFSSSAPFLPALSGPGRIVISATRSGYESNYSRFISFFCESLNDSKADFDKDDQISLLESFLYASKSTRNFYENDNRLVSEHALIDDTGDKKGTPADWFSGLLPQKSPKGATDIDGFKAHQIILIPDEFERSLSLTTRKERNDFESQLRNLRNKKSKLESKDYQIQLEDILTKLANLYFPNNAATAEPPIEEKGN